MILKAIEEHAFVIVCIDNYFFSVIIVKFFMFTKVYQKMV